jgi:hypothetical protein
VTVPELARFRSCGEDASRLMPSCRVPAADAKEKMEAPAKTAKVDFMIAIFEQLSR